MRRQQNATLTSILATALTGCAGYHSVPPPNYSAAPEPRVLRIVFDQAGDPYPQSDDTSGLRIPTRPPNRNSAFTLRTRFKGHRPPYDRERLLDAAASALISGMEAAGAKRVVFLIKGFNNDYQSFDDEYAWLRNRVIAGHEAPGLYFVQVYWDAIHKGKGTFPVPLAYFADSLTYSNRAGDCGLRGILRRLPAATDVTFVTHSRGAAVAVAAVSDPHDGKKIVGACRLSIPGNELASQLGDVRLVAFAPAIGDGHMRDGSQVRTAVFSQLDRFYVGYNPNDPAVTKRYFGINLPDRYGGDTRLGGDAGYVAHIDELYEHAGLSDEFQYERFSRKSHAWEDYVAQDYQARCLLWAGKLLASSPKGCNSKQ